MKRAMKYDCLIIDDEKLLADSTAEYFNLFGVQTAVVYDAAGCRDFLKENTARLFLLDINLGETSDDDMILAFHIGGDDYIQKPYSLGVLLAKVQVVLKRMGPEKLPDYDDGYLCVDLEAGQVRVEGQAVRLTSLGFRLLAYLIQNKDKVVSKQELFEEVWRARCTGDGTLNVHIRKIREAVEQDPGRPVYIHTVWGEGYRFSGGGR